MKKYWPEIHYTGAVPLFYSYSFKKNGSLAIAMEARGYQGGNQRDHIDS